VRDCLSVKLHRDIPRVTLGAALLLIAAATLIPSDADSRTEFTPLGEVAEAIGEPDPGLLLETVANVALFVPFGAALALSGFSTRRSILCGLVLSTSIELAHLLVIPGRTASVDDVLLNTLGTLLGCRLVSEWRRRTV
jgi:glycopeptide antibiotics resistance protein